MRTNIRSLMLTDWCRRSDSKQDKETKSMKMWDLVYLVYTLRQAQRGRPTSMCIANKRQWPAASTAGVQRSQAGVGEAASPGRLSGAGTAGFADPERNQLQTRAQGLSSSVGPIPGGREQGKSGARTRSTQHPLYPHAVPASGTSPAPPVPQAVQTFGPRGLTTRREPARSPPS